MATPTATSNGTYKPRYDLNQLMVEGNLGRDPEMRYTPQGQAVTTATIGVQAGNHTNWFRIKAWREAAEKLNDGFTKGDKIRVSGNAELEEWDGNDGLRHAQMTIVTGRASDISLVFAKGTPNDEPGYEAPPQSGDPGYDPAADELAEAQALADQLATKRRAKAAA